MMTSKEITLTNENGIVKGTIRITPNYSYNEDTKCDDIPTPKVDIVLGGKICVDDEATIIEEIKNFVRNSFL